MSKTKDAILEILLLLSPLILIRLRKVDKLVDEKINKLVNGEKVFLYMAGYETLDISVAEEFLSKTFEARKSLEDKAKINVFGVTIVVTLMVGLSQVFYNNFPSNLFLRVLTIILAFYSLISMIIATILSLMVLGKLNRVYDLNPSDKSLTTTLEEKLTAIAKNTELNMNYNIKRNNYLYSSYALISTFLLSLLLLFLIVLIPYHGNNSVALQKIQDSQIEIYKEVYKINQFQQTQNHLLSDIEGKVQASENKLTLQVDRIKKLEEANKEMLKKIEILSKQKSEK